MPTVQTGPRGTIDLSNDLVVQEMLAKVSLLDPSDKPITTTLNHFDKALPTDTPEPQHAEDELFPNNDTVNGAHTAADPTIAVDNPLFYLVGDVLHCPRTGENMRVTSAPGTSPITVTRALGTAPAALVDGDVLWILGGAQREGDTSRNAVNTLEVPYTHFVQIMRNSIEATGTQLATRQHGGDFDDQFEKKLIEHKRQMEYFTVWGTPSRTQESNQWVRTMEGLYHRIQTNRMDINGVLTEGEFDAFCQMGFQYGNSRKMLLASPRVVTAINNFGKSKLVTVPQDERYGFAIREYTSPHGDVEIVNTREFKGETYGGMMMLLDYDYMMIRYLRGGAERPDKYQGSLYCKRIRNIQANDADIRKDEIFSEMCIQLEQERTCAVGMGITG